MAYYMPPELVETIVSFVSHRPTLKACALAGPAFTIPAHRCLFYEVVLSPPRSRCRKRTPAHRFLNLLTTSPHLAPFVNSLAIECEDSVEEQQPWLYSDDHLQHILPLLTKLTKVSVNGRLQPEDERMTTKASLCWTSLSSSLRAALALLMRSGSVVDLELGGFSRIPVSSVIESCSRLKKLSLLPLYLVDDTPVPEANPEEGAIPTQNRVHLEDINIRQSCVALRRTADWLLSPTCHLDVGQLKRLHFEVSTLEDHHHISRIVETCSTSLEYLEVTPGSEVNAIRHLLGNMPAERSSTPAFRLDTLNTLKTLKINARIIQFKMNNTRFSDPIPWLVSVLSTLPDSNGLSELVLSFALQLSREVLSRASWQDLTSVLSSTKFGGLQRVSFDFSRSIKEGHAEEWMLWVKDVMSQNPHVSPLLTRGVLHVDI